MYSNVRKLTLPACDDCRKKLSLLLGIEIATLYGEGRSQLEYHSCSKILFRH